jgi:phosphate transport system substrate-binding protein
MEPLLLVWADEFSKLHPGFHLEVKSSDSAAAPKALISGLASLGPMSREMTSEEVAAFEKRFSYAPTRVLVALDPLGVFVNAGNPLSKLGMDQLDAIYSKSRNAGYKKVTTWGDLGLTEDFKKQPIEVFDQATASTARRFFQETVLQKGDFKPGIKPITGAFGASDVVATNLFAISYGPVNFATSNNVKTLPLIPIGMTMAVEPTLDNIQKRLYPLTRMFFIYINKTPGKPLPPVVSEFLSFIFSREGQIQVENIGSVPLPAGVLNGNRGRIMN